MKPIYMGLVLVLLWPSLATAQDLLCREAITVSLQSDVTSKAVVAPFSARLEESVRNPGCGLLPEGTLFHGHTEATPARWRQRSGHLRLVFDTMTLPDGTVRQAGVLLTSVDLNSLKSDSEGVVQPRSTKKRIILEAASGAMVAKAVDDIAEVASAGVTKNTARFVGLAGVAAFFLLQRGSNVRIPAGTQIQVEFERPGAVLPTTSTLKPQNRPPRALGKY